MTDLSWLSGILVALVDSRGSRLFLEPDGHRATVVSVDDQLPFDLRA